MRFAPLLVLLISAPPALAQVAFFPDGERVTSVSALVQRYPYQTMEPFNRNPDDKTGWLIGGEVGTLLSPKFGLSVGAAVTSDIGAQRSARIYSLGLSFFASRQGSGEPITLEVGAGLGYVGGDRVPVGPTLGVGVEVSRAIGLGSPVCIVASVSGTTTFLFLNEYSNNGLTLGGFTNGQALAPGLAIVIAPTGRAALFAEPTVIFSFAGARQDPQLGVRAGLAFTY